MKPLIKRAQDGRRVVVPSTPRQSTNGHASAPKPTPPQPGRHRGMSKLTDDDVRAIRADYAAGKWSVADLAYIYGVSKCAIGGVVRGKSYKHVTSEPTPQQQHPQES